MRVMCILGTRPEIIRLSRVICVLRELCEFVLVDTGQNYVPTLKDLFYRELRLAEPDIAFESQAELPMAQVGKIFQQCEVVLRQQRPDRVLLLGDTNSALSSVVAKRLGIPVFHMEAGNRCYDDRVPEEVNRRIIDHSSDVLMPYTERSRDNLLREGIHPSRIYVTGNPIREVLDHYQAEIRGSDILSRIDVAGGRYFLVTMHRAENVDLPARLSAFVDALRVLQREYGVPVVFSVHPRTASKLSEFGLTLEGGNFRLTEPLGLFDFVRLEKEAMCVLSDSGTVQEECCIFGVPNATLRDVTERPETVEVGSNIITGEKVESIVGAVRLVLKSPPRWNPPAEYLVSNVSSTVAKVVLGEMPGWIRN